MKVLIVDDSVVYRSQIKAALANQTGIEIVGAASNGKIALEMLEQKEVDVMTLDMEMPVMNGLETLRALRDRGSKVKVIVFSSSTRSGSEATLDALGAGAKDFVAKPDGSATIGGGAEELIRKDLLPKLRQFVNAPAPGRLAPRVDISPAPVVAAPSAFQAPSQTLVNYSKKDLATFMPSVIVIASSTGGPAAHDAIFKGLSGKLRCPIL
ncbi:MAG: response regulator, partial [Proteobacteria bacterium]